MKKKFLTIFAAISIIFLMNFSAGATTNIYTDYDGDPGFPRLTWQYDVGSLASFDGTAFRALGFTALEKSTIISNISTLLYQDFAPYDIEFVTDTTGLLSYKTIGVDDKAYVFTDGPPYPTPINPSDPCPPGSNCYRLFGKTANAPGDVALDGTPIYYPDDSRIFGGSFALGPGSASPSQPSLFGHTLGDISQALANMEAHEIAHFFGLQHPGAYPGPGNLMWIETEGIESTINKSFSAGDQAILMGVLGPREVDGGKVPEPATMLLLGSGLLGLWRARKKFKK